MDEKLQNYKKLITLQNTLFLTIFHLNKPNRKQIQLNKLNKK